MDRLLACAGERNAHPSTLEAGCALRSRRAVPPEDLGAEVGQQPRDGVAIAVAQVEDPHSSQQWLVLAQRRAFRRPRRV